MTNVGRDKDASPLHAEWGSSPRVAIRDLSVSYGSHRALQNLDLEVLGGTIVGLLGANGSGKSTTVKALTGINPPEPGSRIEINGKVVQNRQITPVEARRRGIRVVHQEAPIIGDLTVAELMAMHIGFPLRLGVIRGRELFRRSRSMLDEFDIDIDPDRLCGDLSAGERALVSFVIALAGIKPERALLILDEATASLSTRDASQYLDHVRGAADRGLAVIMVTHRLLEVHEYCDRSLVLRDGRAVAEFDQSSFSEVAIVHAMVGETSTRVAGARNDAGVSRGDRDLRIEGLFGDGVNGVSFSASAGEIVGLTGRSGGGASEVLRLVGGLTVPEAGSVWIGAHKLELGQPRRSIEHGVYFISADRSREGGISVLSVEDNLVLPRVERFGLARARMRAEALRMIDEMDVRPNDPDVPFGNLSGGNQQKVLLGRWLLLSPQVLLMDDPTAGVDPNARETIFAALDDLRADGVTILIRSTEPPQLARLCDRVLVFRDGELVNELNGNDINTEEISLATYA